MADTAPMITGDGVTWQQVHIDDGKVTVSLTQDVEPLIDSNKRAYNGDKPKELLGRRVASIPRNEVYNMVARLGMTPHQWMQLPWGEQRKILAREIINNRDFQYFRTAEGHF